MEKRPGQAHLKNKMFENEISNLSLAVALWIHQLFGCKVRTQNY